MELMEISTSIFVAVVGAVALIVSALVSGTFGAFAMRGLRRAEANAITSTEWKRLYDERGDQLDEVREDLEHLNSRVDTLLAVEESLEKRVTDLQEQLASTRSKLKETVKTLEVAELNIQFLLEYMQENGLEIPNLRFRGG